MSRTHSKTNPFVAITKSVQRFLCESENKQWTQFYKIEYITASSEDIDQM